MLQGWDMRHAAEMKFAGVSGHFNVSASDSD
jgi:hypothetical protein